MSRMDTPSEKDGIMKLVDTDIFIDFLRNMPAAREFIEQHLYHINFSAITEAELLSVLKIPWNLYT